MKSPINPVTLRKVTLSDAREICKIYNHYIVDTIITFEEVRLSVEEMEKRITDVAAHFPWIIAELNGQLLGYAYAGKWQSRSAYRHSAESSIYLSPEAGGQGIGRMLYQELLHLLKKQRIHTVIAGIALPNLASISLHKKLGFEPVAQLKEVGYKQNQWIDVAYWQLLLQ